VEPAHASKPRPVFELAHAVSRALGPLHGCRGCQLWDHG
jgi:hypothetical protein